MAKTHATFSVTDMPAFEAVVADLGLALGTLHRIASGEGDAMWARTLAEECFEKLATARLLHFDRPGSSGVRP